MQEPALARSMRHRNFCGHAIRVFGIVCSVVLGRITETVCFGETSFEWMRLGVIDGAIIAFYELGLMNVGKECNRHAGLGQHQAGEQ